MTHLMKKVLIAAGLTVAPVLPAMLGSPAEAHSSGISVSVVVPTRAAVFGFSYGNPIYAGHVHYAPVPCTAGPLYYYPAYRVYGHYHPRISYQYYDRPVYYQARPPIHRHYSHAAPVHWKKSKHHDKHRYHNNGHHDDDDN